MNIKQAFHLSFQSLLKNKVRALQSTSIFIVALISVFTVICIAQGLLNQIKIQVANYNFGVIWVSVYERMDTFSRDTLTDEDWQRLVQENPDLICAVSPIVYVFDYVDGLVYDDKLYGNNEVIIEGVNEDFIKINKVLQIEQGRFLQHMDVEREQNVCVIGSNIANKIIDGNALGQSVKIAGNNFSVIGVLKEIDVDAENWNNTVLLPSSCALKITGADYRAETFGGIGSYFSSYFVGVTSAESVVDARVAIRSMLESCLNTTDVANITPLKWQEKQMSQGLSVVFAPFVLFSFLVLMVGGCGIMNMMVVLVKERTKEIGIRKAFGATNTDIQKQFLCESVCITIIGCVVGIVFAVPIIYIVCAILHLPLDVIGIPLIPLVGTVLVAVGTGMLFGTYPAQQAAKLEPVAAINSD